MMGLKKMTVWKFVFTLTILMTMSSYAFPWWYVNASENGFGGGAESSSDLESYIIEGAGYFLESYSDTLLFMKKVELSGRDGLDHGELSALLGSALTNMEQANKTYGALKQRADGTPYNTAVTGSLQGFDYDGFGAANGLEKGVVDRVKHFLSKGDVRSVYREIVMDTGTIAGLLKELKEQVDGGAFPSIKDTWKLNRAFSQSLGFGQCVAEVFDRVLAEN